MKKTIIQGIVLVVILVGIWAAGDWYGSHKASVSAPNTVPLTATTGTPTSHPSAPSQPAPLISPNQWPQYLSARNAAFKANPDLDTQYKQILKKIEAQQAKIDAAVVKIDPKAKPIIAKLVQLRLINTSPTDRPAGSKPAPLTAATQLTQDDMQELRTARAKALQANPDLVTNAKDLTTEMRAFEDKLNAAMIKADPNVVPIVAKFDNQQKPSATPASPPPTR